MYVIPYAFIKLYHYSLSLNIKDLLRYTLPLNIKDVNNW